MILEKWFSAHERDQYSRMPISVLSFCLAGTGVWHP